MTSFDKYIYLIYRLTTYRPLFSLCLAVLILNAFVLKELQCQHDCHHQEVDKHEHCKSDTHLHEYNFEAKCYICEFSFSTKEPVDFRFIEIAQELVFSITFYDKKINIRSFSGTVKLLRGPPVKLA